MRITDLSHEDALAAVKAATEVSAVRDMATELDLTFSGNTGVDTLKGKVIAKLNEMAQTTPAPVDVDAGKDKDEPVIEPIPAPVDLDKGTEPIEDIQIATLPEKKEEVSIDEMLEMDPTQVEDPLLRRRVIRAKALRLRRVAVNNLDPADSSLSGTILTVINKYTGKVSKYIPFGEGSENGYHIPQILYDELKSKKFVLRREKKGGSFGVKKYSNTLVPKYQITDLPDLSPDEIENLAKRQAATQAIG